MNEFLKQWENHMLGKGRSIKTIEAYLSDVDIFLNWIKQDKKISTVTVKNLKKVTLNDLDNFIGYLRQPKVDKKGKKREGNSFSTVARRGNAIKTFYRYLQKNLKLINRNDNVALDWELPSPKKRVMGFLNEEEAQLLINSVGKRNKVRNTAILMLFLNAGLRRQELIDINIGDLKGNKLKVNGKGDKERELYISDECLKIINMWLETRDNFNPTSPALFVSENGLRMSVNAVYSFIKDCMRKIGRDDCSPHSCRHTFAHLTLDNGNNLKELQEALGHASLTTTGIYAHVTDSQKQKLAKSISKFKVNLNNKDTEDI